MYHMRCSQGKNGCGVRFTIRKPPHQYLNPVKCPECGCTDLQDVEKAVRVDRRNKARKGKRCYCSGYPFPHLKGTLRFCEQHKLKAVEPSQDEWGEYQQVLETPRGSFI